MDSTELDTLTDYLEEGLDLVFVGLNPSSFSVEKGHYFANPRNRFWAALNRSGLVSEALSPERDTELLRHGIGFTDVVKRPTPQASGLTAADYRRWSPVFTG
jgi:TDG/mug DNA glycosylase family protein